MTCKTVEGLWAWLCDNGVVACPVCGSRAMENLIVGLHDGKPVVTTVCRRGHEGFTPDLEETQPYGFTLAAVSTSESSLEDRP